MSISGSTFSSNRGVNGAAASVSGFVSLSVSNASFVNNTASSSGGAVILTSLDSQYVAATLSSTTFSSNTAAFGGALALTAGSSLNLTASQLTNNKATYAGALFALQVNGQPSSSPPPVLALSQLTATGNTASTGSISYTDVVAPVTSVVALNCTQCVLTNNTPATPVAGFLPALVAPQSNASVSVRSGTVASSFVFALVDFGGQIVPNWPSTYFTVAAPSSLAGLSGTLTVPYANSGARFSSLTITDTPGVNYTLSATLVTSLPAALNSAGAAITAVVAPCRTAEVFNAASGQCQCAAGTFQNTTSGLCATCPAGSYAPTAGATSCIQNSPGFASVTQSVISSTLTFGGLAAASFGASQNATLQSAIGSTLNVSASAVTITSVSDTLVAPAGRHLSLSALSAAFAIYTTSSKLATTLSTSLSASTAFSTSLAARLHATNDALLSTVSAASISAAQPTTSSQTLASEPCQPGTFLNSSSLICEDCPPGQVSTSTAASSCKPCPAGQAWVNASLCVSCPASSITSPVDPAACACTLGYYDLLFGAVGSAPICAPCPLIGAECTSGLVAAKEGFWRETTQSDIFYQCREGNCEAEEVIGPLSPLSSNSTEVFEYSPNATVPTNCVEGNTGPLCALCLPGYAVQSGVCSACDPSQAFDAWSTGDKAALLVLACSAGAVILVFGLFQSISPALEATWQAIERSFWSTVESAKARLTCACCSPRANKEAQKKEAEAKDGANHAAAAVHSAEKPAHHPTALQEARQDAQTHAVDSMIAAGIGQAIELIELADDMSGGGEEAMEEVLLDGYHGLEELFEKIKGAMKIITNYYQVHTPF